MHNHRNCISQQPHESATAAVSTLFGHCQVDPTAPRVKDSAHDQQAHSTDPESKLSSHSMCACFPALVTATTRIGWWHAQPSVHALARTSIQLGWNASQSKAHAPKTRMASKHRGSHRQAVGKKGNERAGASHRAACNAAPGSTACLACHSSHTQQQLKLSRPHQLGS